LPAKLRGYTETPIYAKIAGYLRVIKVDKGDRVKKNQVLAVLESPELDQQVANARAAYDLDVITDQRNQALTREGVLPRQTADESHNTMLAAKATLQQYRATEEYKIITAPYSGVVTARNFDAGALIPQTTASSGNTPILTVATLSPLRVYSDVPQDIAPFIRDGDPADVTVGEYPDRIFRGKVTRHPEALTPATRTMLVEVDLPNSDQVLFPGMYARVVLHVAAPARAPMVPDDALVFRDGKPYVPVVCEDILKLIPVSLGFDDGVNVEVTGEISDQDMVALNVGQAAHDGERVQPITAQPQQSAPAQ
jgi:membrane fusion protein (multidrug efflux system)